MIKIILFLLALSLQMQAHQTGISYLEMTQKNKSIISVIYKKPLEDLKAEDLKILYPQECSKVSLVKNYMEDGYAIKKYLLNCNGVSLSGSRIWIEGLVSLDRGVIVLYKSDTLTQQALLSSSKPFMQIDLKYFKGDLFFEYLSLGIEHILRGYDHLMFVFLMILLAKNLKVLLYAITAFTLSHSFTLFAATLGILTVSISYVESMIALSIVFLAREVISNNRDSLTRKYFALVAFCFGLLHGFGFSSVLSSIGLPQDEIPLALLSFNIGIELGQLLFIGFVYINLIFFNKYLDYLKEKILKISVYMIGTISFYWFIDRSDLFNFL